MDSDFDYLGGARVSLVVFGAGDIQCVEVPALETVQRNDSWEVITGGQVVQLRYLLSGIGNRSVSRMTPMVFTALSQCKVKGDSEES